MTHSFAGFLAYGAQPKRCFVWLLVHPHRLQGKDGYEGATTSIAAFISSYSMYA
jgi:hypothetical protein